MNNDEYLEKILNRNNQEIGQLYTIVNPMGITETYFSPYRNADLYNLYQNFLNENENGTWAKFQIVLKEKYDMHQQ